MFSAVLGMGLAGCGNNTNAEPSKAESALAADEPASKTEVAAVEPAPAPAPSKPQPAETRVAAATAEPVCSTCGTITAIEQRTKEGEGTGIGAATGAVLGAIAGREIVGGKRSHRDAAAVAGAIGGGYAGHKIEEKARSTNYFVISVRMDSDHRTETVTLESSAGWAVGDKVRVDNGALSHR
jgi:outer membrane lipoprotein SlyB